MENHQGKHSKERACLLGLTGSLAGVRIPIEAQRTVIGRDATQCDIALDQAVVSRQHAALEFGPENTATIIDLGSSHGTFVNGERVTTCTLKEGDSIGLGPQGVVAFTYRATKRSADVSPAGKERADTSRESPATALRRQLAASAQLATAKLSPPDAGAGATPSALTRELPVLRIGRAPDNEIVLEAPGVSRYHASLTYTNGAQPALTDLSSTNGTFVNGEPVLQPRLLSPDDLVFLGGFLLRVNGRDVKWHDLSASRISALTITKQIGNKIILKDISLAISPREFVGLMGPSGCGKSTLMDALNGLPPPLLGQSILTTSTSTVTSTHCAAPLGTCHNETYCTMRSQSNGHFTMRRGCDCPRRRRQIESNRSWMRSFRLSGCKSFAPTSFASFQVANKSG